MSDSKKSGLNCPVCDCIVSCEDLTVHVNQHYNDFPIECNYPGCSAIVDESQLDDHILAHNVCDANTKAVELISQLNDSALARIIQNEEDIAGPSSVSDEKSDELLARQIHLENNKKEEEEGFKVLKEKYGMTDDGGYVKQFEKEMDKKVGGKVSINDYFTMKSNMFSSLISGNDNGETRTTGLIKLFNSSCTQAGKGLKIYFSIETDHFSVGVGDKGWGCGYRNIQMLLSSMLNNEVYRKNLSFCCNDNNIPSVPKLQMLIEQAWKEGYDTAGCDQLGGCLQGTKKWIGTTEVAALLSWLKINAKIVDFHQPTGEDKTHPQLFNWIHDYFKSRHTDGGKPPFPLYIQHQGHSRLCIGCEVSNTQDFPIKLILFDPSYQKSKTQLSLPHHGNQWKNLKKSIKQMNKCKQFQLLYIDGLLSTESEIENSKAIRSVRIPP